MNVFVNVVLIVVMVPKKNFNEVKEAIFASGGGSIGNYEKCSSSFEVTGTFMPNEKANPTVGKANTLETVNEIRLETVCKIEKVKAVINAIRKVHPYEEHAIDIIPLIDEKNFK